jgi:hypothetical protein
MHLIKIEREKKTCMHKYIYIYSCHEHSMELEATPRSKYLMNFIHILACVFFFNFSIKDISHSRNRAHVPEALRCKVCVNKISGFLAQVSFKVTLWLSFEYYEADIDIQTGKKIKTLFCLFNHGKQ